MKPILIATAILAAAGIAIIQQSKLSDLKAETARLEARKTPSAMKRADLVRLSSSGRQVIAEHSSHHIHIDEPNLVVDAIRDVVERARK